jgi:hypothetical protein
VSGVIGSFPSRGVIGCVVWRYRFIAPSRVIEVLDPTAWSVDLRIRRLQHRGDQPMMRTRRCGIFFKNAEVGE